MKINKFFLIACLVFALLTRLLFLNKFPIGITHDELNNIFVAKSLFLTHAFPSGTAPAVLPTGMSNFTVTVPEVPVAILAFLIGALPTGLFTGRVVGALLSVASVVAVYFIVLELTKKPLYARVGSLLMVINPWSFLMGRTMAELNFFIAFFLWGFLVLLKTRGWRIFYALPFYLLGFFSYTGGQISFLFFILITIAYHFFTTKKKSGEIKIYALFAGIAIGMFAIYVLIATNNQTFRARGSELNLPNSPDVSQTVDTQRKLSAPDPLNKLFINKVTAYAEGFASKYMNTFSVGNLFLTGETRAIFSFQIHGTFYLIDFLFIILGLSSLYALNKKVWWLFVAIIAGCSVTSGLSLIENSYSQRAGLIFPSLIMLSGMGIVAFINAVKSKIVRRITAVAVVTIYLISFANLLHIYFFRFPIYASDGWFFQDRVLARYIQLTESSFPASRVEVYTSEPKIIFEEYLFFTNLYNPKTASSVNERMANKDYSIGDISVTDKCPDKFPANNSVIIFDGSFGCSNLAAPADVVRITRFRDVYANYLIYHDVLCKNAVLPRYVSQDSYGNFDVGSQPAEQFCSSWITKIK